VLLSTMKTWTSIAVSRRTYAPGLLLVLSLAVCAHASSVVNATDNIYGAGLASAPGGGTVPGSLSVLGTSSIRVSSIVGSITASCASAEGCITLNGGSFNDPDGVGNPQPTFTSPGTAVLSGITAPNAGFLLGVFVPAGGPSGAAPAALVFATTSFTTLSPLLDQVFFIGDGLTGDGTGTVQQFNVPTSAASLYLGIVDFGGAYGDNAGTYTVNFSLTSSQAPEPGSWLQAAAGLFALLFIGRQAMARLRVQT
jgi:hypothetical protein